MSTGRALVHRVCGSPRLPTAVVLVGTHASVFAEVNILITLAQLLGGILNRLIAIQDDLKEFLPTLSFPARRNL